MDDQSPPPSDVAEVISSTRRVGGRTADLALAPGMFDPLTLERAATIATRTSPVLIEGESGTGKSTLARWIHARSRDDGRPAVQMGCGEIDLGTGRATLFGHVAGAFTDAKTNGKGLLEAANGTTLILDDVDYLPLPLQSALLAFLDQGTFARIGEGSRRHQARVRVIVTTNKDLDALVAERRFLPDLRERLRRWRIRLLPLRDRPDAVRRLATWLVTTEDSAMSFSPDGLALLTRQTWPGNLRSLAAFVENATVLAPPRTGEIGPETVVAVLADLGMTEQMPDMELRQRAQAPRQVRADAAALAALERHDFNVTAAARHLGWSRTTLYARMKKHRWHAAD